MVNKPEHSMLRFKEGVQINQSLSALGMCITALSLFFYHYRFRVLEWTVVADFK